MAQEAERLGYDSAWAAEAWGTDCVSVLAWLGATTERIKLGSAIMQIPGRTPANTAMTAVTLDLLSNGRLLLGLGTSGPQVVEGWHGEPWGKPALKTREYVEIVRTALRRELVEHHGEHYDIPTATGPDSGSRSRSWRGRYGRTSRSTSRRWGRRRSPRPARSRTAGSRSSGRPSVRRKSFASALASTPPGFDIAPTAPAILIDDVEAGRDFLKPYYALYIGGMGARGKNFYNDLFARYGYEAEAKRSRICTSTGTSETRRLRSPTPSSTRSRSSARRSDRRARRRVARVGCDVVAGLDAAARGAASARRDRALRLG